MARDGKTERPKTCIADHGNIVEPVAKSDALIGCNADGVQQLVNGGGFINIFRHQLQEKRFGFVNADAITEFFRKNTL